jgi:hypothetical protein
MTIASSAERPDVNLFIVAPTFIYSVKSGVWYRP